jgi:hypothetical protein
VHRSLEQAKCKGCENGKIYEIHQTLVETREFITATEISKPGYWANRVIVGLSFADSEMFLR